MGVLYVSFGPKVRPRTFGCVAMGSAGLFILRSRIVRIFCRSEVNRVQVVRSGFSVSFFMFCPGKKLYVGMIVCIYLLQSCLCV